MVTVDPAAATWAVYAKGDDGQFTPWVEPTDYSALAGSPLARVEVRVVDATPSLLVNGVDVSAGLGHRPARRSVSPTRSASAPRWTFPAATRSP
jgi:hypothetical protein